MTKHMELQIEALKALDNVVDHAGTPEEKLYADIFGAAYAAFTDFHNDMQEDCNG